MRLPTHEGYWSSSWCASSRSLKAKARRSMVFGISDNNLDDFVAAKAAKLNTDQQSNRANGQDLTQNHLLSTQFNRVQ